MNNAFSVMQTVVATCTQLRTGVYHCGHCNSESYEHSCLHRKAGHLRSQLTGLSPHRAWTLSGPSTWSLVALGAQVAAGSRAGPKEWAVGL